MIKGLRKLIYEKRLENLGLISLERRKLKSNMIIVVKYPVSVYKEKSNTFLCSHKGQNKE